MFEQCFPMRHALLEEVSGILLVCEVNVLKSTGDKNDGAKKIFFKWLKLITEELMSQSTQLKFHTIRLRWLFIGFQVLYCSTLTKQPCFGTLRHAEICAYVDKYARHHMVRHSL